MKWKRNTRKGNPMKSRLETQDSGKDIENKTMKYLQSFLDGSILASENKLVSLPYVLLLTVLALLYIGNNYYAQEKIREMDRIENQMKELRYEYRSINSKLMFESKQSEIAKKLKGTGIKESTEPPKKIFKEEK